ncbi:N-acyl-D-amino-acid deacylase family protein [Portibacter marinus]|uniref:N-acyl-D-amino-acid deacylase family protein n=1 Tax=Portibacter marinus TaxID=2898660 RepID=UPI001F1C339A|nr:amidohydrolase family protein [Portibacter marinus]
MNQTISTNFWAGIALLLLLVSCKPTASFSIVIRDGQIYDGLGNAPKKGHIGIKEGKMFVLDNNQKFQAEEIIDANGLVIAPGFVDVHSHTPEGIINPERNSNECFIRQGVTTVVGSPDGYWSLDDFKMFQDTIPKIGSGTNVAGYIGHNGVRKAAMGSDQQRKPTTEELDKMKADIEEAMKLGALGLSTGLMYPPGMFSETEEIIALSKVAARYNGIYDSHVRNPVHHWLASNMEVIDIAEKANIPAKMGHIKAVGLQNKGKTKELIAYVDQKRADGLVLVSDQYPYDGAGGQLTLRSIIIPTGNPSVNFPLLQNPMADMSPHLTSEIARKQAKKFTENGINNGFSWVKAIGYDGFRIVDSYDYPDLVGQYISEIALDQQMDPFDLIAQLILDATQPVQVKGGVAEEDLRALLIQPWNMIASDGFLVTEDDPKIGHPRSTGTFPRVLGKYVRDEGLLTMEEAIRKMTSLPADFVGLLSRGKIEDGLPADIVVFDPERIIDRSTYSEPNRFSTGVIHVLVNGQFVLKDEQMTAERPGRFLVRE